MTLRLLALLIALPLAGCLASPSATVDLDDANATWIAPERTDLPVAMYVGGGTPVTGFFFFGGPIGGDFHVGENATALLVEARWSCAAPPSTCGYVLAVWRDEKEVGRASGGGRLVLQVDAPVPGAYEAAMAPEDLAVLMEGEVRATVFYGPVPEGYSAFDEGA